VTVWFRALERVPIKAKWPGAIARMSLDQFLFAPMVLTGKTLPLRNVWLRSLVGFFTYMTLAEGKDMDAVKAKWNSVSLTGVELLLLLSPDSPTSHSSPR
jgi:protein Mpv17